MSTIAIRHATVDDLDAMMEVYDKARRFMRSTGNLEQWTGGYPSRGVVLDDIARGNGYVGEDSRGVIVMAFTFILGDDPTYAVIEDGAWPDSNPYGTIHRLGSDGTCRGVLRSCVRYCLGMSDTIRLDTHADNHPMQRVATAIGFKRCGIIYCQEGHSPRIAYQLTAHENQKLRLS